MLGKKKNKKQEAVKSPFDIGKNGTVEELYAANKKALEAGDTEVRKDLQLGAIAAFKEGNVEKIQVILSDSENFQPVFLSRQTLLSLTGDNDHPAAVISLAIDKIPEQKKQQFLDDILYDVIDSGVYMDYIKFIAALLEAGANANAEFKGAPGSIMATAITNGHPPGIIKLLYDNGADFEDALMRIRTRPLWDKDNLRELSIEKLKAHREAITGQPATEEGEVLKTLNLLRQEIAEMRRDLTGPKPAAAPLPANANGTPGIKRPYPSVKGV